MLEVSVNCYDRGEQCKHRSYSEINTSNYIPCSNQRSALGTPLYNCKINQSNYINPQSCSTPQTNAKCDNDPTPNGHISNTCSQQQENTTCDKSSGCSSSSKLFSRCDSKSFEKLDLQPPILDYLVRHGAISEECSIQILQSERSQHATILLNALDNSSSSISPSARFALLLNALRQSGDHEFANYLDFSRRIRPCSDYSGSGPQNTTQSLIHRRRGQVSLWIELLAIKVLPNLVEHVDIKPDSNSLSSPVQDLNNCNNPISPSSNAIVLSKKNSTEESFWINDKNSNDKPIEPTDKPASSPVASPHCFLPSSVVLSEDKSGPVKPVVKCKNQLKIKSLLTCCCLPLHFKKKQKSKDFHQSVDKNKKSLEPNGIFCEHTSNQTNISSDVMATMEVAATLKRTSVDHTDGDDTPTTPVIDIDPQGINQSESDEQQQQKQKQQQQRREQRQQQQRALFLSKSMEFYELILDPQSDIHDAVVKFLEQSSGVLVLDCQLKHAPGINLLNNDNNPTDTAVTSCADATTTTMTTTTTATTTNNNNDNKSICINVVATQIELIERLCNACDSDLSNNTLYNINNKSDNNNNFGKASISPKSLVLFTSKLTHALTKILIQTGILIKLQLEDLRLSVKLDHDEVELARKELANLDE